MFCCEIVHHSEVGCCLDLSPLSLRVHIPSALLGVLTCIPHLPPPTHTHKSFLLPLFSLKHPANYFSLFPLLPVPSAHPPLRPITCWICSSCFSFPLPLPSLYAYTFLFLCLSPLLYTSVSHQSPFILILILCFPIPFHLCHSFAPAYLFPFPSFCFTLWSSDYPYFFFTYRS